MTARSHLARRLAPLVVLLAVASVAATGSTPIDPALHLDTAPDGPTVRLSEVGPGPYIVVPIFANCRSVCTTVARTLADAWGPDGPPECHAPVVLVSFDPKDTAADLIHFRRMFELPAEWRLATLEREEGLRFFESLGFRWRTLSERQFDHAGKIFILSDRLAVSAVLGPGQLTTRRLSSEVDAARAGASPIRRLGTHWIGFFSVGALLLLLVSLVARDRIRTRNAA